MNMTPIFFHVYRVSGLHYEAEVRGLPKYQTQNLWDLVEIKGIAME